MKFGTIGKLAAIAAAVALVALATAGPAFAQPEKLDKYSLELFGGTWMADCANPNSAKVIVAETSLTFENGKNKVVGTNFRGAASWFGENPPENYVMAMLADQPEDLQFLAVVYKDAKGQYLVLDGDPKLMAAVGKPYTTTKFRKCGPDKAAKATTTPDKATATAKATAKAEVPVAASTAAGASEAPSFSVAEVLAGEMLPPAYGMLEDPGFKKAYTKALGKLGKEPWLATLSGPSSESKKVTIAGDEYVLTSSCKEHDCYENNMVVVYSAAKKIAYGKVYMAGKSSMFGNPPPPVAKEIGEYWRQAFRANP